MKPCVLGVNCSAGPSTKRLEDGRTLRRATPARGLIIASHREYSVAMNLSWKRKLPTGDALEEEAARLGVSLQEIYKGGAQGRTILNEPELQRRILAAWADRRNARLWL